MSNCDLVIGLSAAKLDQVVRQIYSNPHLRESVFAGSKSATYAKVNATISWEAQSPPTVELRAPTPGEWKGAIKENGNPAPPCDGAFIVNLSKLSLKVDASPEKLDTTVPLSVICAAQSSGERLSLTAIAVRVNLSNATPLDKFLIERVLVPGILGMVNKSLGGLKIAAPTFGGVTFTAGTVVVASDHLLLGFNLAQRGAPALEGVQVPGDPFFVLMSPALLKVAVDYEVQKNLQGQPFNKHGSAGGGGFSGNYDASGSIREISVTPTGSPITFHAQTSLSLTASAGIDLPGGFIIDAGKVVANTAEKVVEKIIDPDTWNPSKW